MSRPRLLDLFCGAGGSAVGYFRAGFDVEGVDIKPQPHYPFKFYQADALIFSLEGYDAYHASPPCQGVSATRCLPWLANKDYEVLIAPVRKRLKATGKPYVIENVMRAKWGSKQLERFGLSEHGMQAGWLCGCMFGLSFYRQRLFETNFAWLQPGHPKHRRTMTAGRMFGARLRESHSQLGKESGWMDSNEAGQSISSIYTEYIGKYLLEAVCRS